MPNRSYLAIFIFVVLVYLFMEPTAGGGDPLLERPSTRLGQRLALLLRPHVKPKFSDDNMNELIESIFDLFIDKKDSGGGVYCVRLKDAHVIDVNTGIEHVVIKFGRADNFNNRKSQFGFEYETVFLINGDNGMEAWLKKRVPKNLFRTFWERAKTDTVKTNYLGMPASRNPGITEWRIVSRPFYNRLKARADAMNNLNYMSIFTELISAATAEKVEPGQLKFRYGPEYSVASKTECIIH